LWDTILGAQFSTSSYIKKRRRPEETCPQFSVVVYFYFEDDTYSLEKKFLLPRPENGVQGQKMGDFVK
jgi:hypothetical protein